MTPDLDRALLGWPHLVSLVTMFGTAAFVLLSAGDQASDVRSAAGSLLTLWRFLAAVIFLVSPLVLFNITADMASVSWTSTPALVPEVLAETHACHIFDIYLPITFALLLTAIVPLPQFFRTGMLLLLAGALLLLQALVSHAIDKGTGAVTVYFLHEVAAGLWMGALLALWITVRYGRLPDIWVQQAARRVSKLAFWSVVGVVLTGTFTAYEGLGFDLYRLLFSAYGRTLVAKVIIFAGVVALGAYNRYRLVPAVHTAQPRQLLLRNVAIESVLLIGVLGLAALLANTPPPHWASGHSGHPMTAM